MIECDLVYEMRKKREAAEAKRERAKRGKGTKHRKLLLCVAVEVLIEPSLSLIATSLSLDEAIVEGGGTEAAEADAKGGGEVEADLL